MTALVQLTDVVTGESWVIDTRTPLWDRSWWVTSDGSEVLPIAEMEDSHIGHVIAWLRRRPNRLHRAAVADSIRWMSGPLGPRGDVASDCADREFDQLAWQKPAEWLEHTTIMRALKAELVLRHEPWLVDHDEREERARRQDRIDRAAWENEQDFRAWQRARRNGW